MDGGIESVALDAVGFQFVRDVMPGEAVFITEEGQLHTDSVPKTQ